MTTTLFLNTDAIGQDADGAYSAEASSLGFPPGRWPAAITYNDRRYAAPVVEQDADGDITVVTYHHVSGARLRVFND